MWALFAIPLARQLESGVLVGLVWSCVRPVLIFGIVTSARVRERGYLVLAQLMVRCVRIVGGLSTFAKSPCVQVSFLVTLYHVNELVQRKDVSFLVSPPQSSSRLQADNAAPSLAGTPSPINALTVAFNSATTFYFGSFAFSLLHYILFALVIGIRRRRNPFANRRVSGFRGSTWGEQGWEGVEELVRPDDELSDGGEGDVGAEGDELLDDDEDASSSEDDEDDIVDVARPSLRSRASRASMWTAGGHEESPHRGGDESDSGSTLPRSRSRQAGLQDSGLRNSSKYGSIHSLGQCFLHFVPCIDS